MDTLTMGGSEQTTPAQAMVMMFGAVIPARARYHGGRGREQDGSLLYLSFHAHLHALVVVFANRTRYGREEQCP
jgi:hypothetical protein